MKVIIIGAGLSGLTAAVALRKYLPSDEQSLDIKVYERRDAGQPMGAAISLQYNGLHVLRDLDSAIYDKVLNRGNPCKHFTFKTAGDILLGRSYLDVVPISRQILLDCIAESLPDDIVSYRAVSKVVTRQGLKPSVQFEDGSADETADLVIAADGIGSRTRHDLFGDDRKYHAAYSGKCAVGGVLEVPVPQSILDDPSLYFIMGATGVFGYGCLSKIDTNKLLYYSIYDTNEPPTRGQRPDLAATNRQLRERHQDWADPLLRQCLDKAQVDNVWPIFVMPDLPYWGRDGCVLIGDAPHALPPKSGQGSSQGFEDAQTLALLLAGYMQTTTSEDAISRSIEALYELRADRVKKIRQAAEWAKEPKMPMSWLMMCAMYTAIYVGTKLEFFAKMVGAEDKWNARDEVRKYFASRDGSAEVSRSYRFILPS